MHGLQLALLVALVGLTAAQDLADPRCGTAETDYAPCVEKKRIASEGCQTLCQYETDELKARNLLGAQRQDWKHVSTVLYCASQNQDNRKCCEHLNLADQKLGVGNRCLRFCDPAGEGITSVSRSDVSCLFNWNVLMFCHHSGIKLE
ncbi:DB domain-containing protein [Aphelenchoides fujianensis]|nr:DB domain-containing protein [Aphelenchoides fujianensis]